MHELLCTSERPNTCDRNSADAAAPLWQARSVLCLKFDCLLMMGQQAASLPAMTHSLPEMKLQQYHYPWPLHARWQCSNSCQHLSADPPPQITTCINFAEVNFVAAVQVEA